MQSLVEWIRQNWTLLAFILGLALIFVVLRTRPTEGVDSAQTLNSVLTTGQPVVLEFYSNL
jgi:hypothetical protein